MEYNYDVLIVGTGAAGLHCALNLDTNVKILMVSKGAFNENNTYLAQGGISTARGIEDIEAFVSDTLKAGQFENNIDSVNLLAKDSIDIIGHLRALGMNFDTNSNGKISYTKEGAHSINRIVHVKDQTGKFLWQTLMNDVKNKKNITLMDNTFFYDILQKDNCCYGGLLIKGNKNITVYSKCVVFATGGIGGIFKNSTNQPLLTGDAISIALKNNITTSNLEYIQFHPTGLYDNNYYGRRFLISEALRGEGGKLLNENGQRFVNELSPRDVVTKAIMNEISQSKLPYVFLDISFLNKEYIIKRFPNIYSKCANIGIDISKDPMLVIPSQHYHMGGIKVNLNSQTSMERLYAIGETSCTGVHGKNRLASNSLLEALTFSKRAALSINKKICTIPSKNISWKLKVENDIKNIKNKYKNTLIKAIQRRSPELNDELFNYR